MIIITRASRKVMVKPGVRNWNVPELLSWYFFSMLNGSSRLSVPAWTAASAAIMIEILRVLAEGKTISPLRSAVAPVWRSFRYRAGHVRLVLAQRVQLRDHVLHG